MHTTNSDDFVFMLCAWCDMHVSSSSYDMRMLPQTTLFSCYAHASSGSPPPFRCDMHVSSSSYDMRMLPRDRRRPSGARCENEIDGTDATDAWCMHGVVTALRTCMHPPPHLHVSCGTGQHWFLTLAQSGSGGRQCSIAAAGVCPFMSTSSSS